MDINIEKIMEEIRKEIRVKGYKMSDLTIADISMGAGTEIHVGENFSFSDYESELRSMENRWEVPLEPSYTSNNRIIQFVKKVIKKACRFFIFPMTTLQNGFNGSVVRANYQIRNYIKLNEEEKEEMKKRIEELEKIIIELKEG